MKECEREQDLLMISKLVQKIHQVFINSNFADLWI